MFVIIICLAAVGCRGTDVIPTVTTVSSPTPVPTYTTAPTKTPQPQPTATTQTLLSPTPTSTAKPQPIPILDDTVILVATIQNEYWAIKTFPPHPGLNADVFDQFYGRQVQMEDVRRYTQFNFGPQLSPNGRYLLLPGVGGYGGAEYGVEYTGLWLVNLQTDEARQLLPQAKIATWSPYGDHITYVDGDTLYTLSMAAGAEPEPLFTNPNLSGLYARWAPDGSTIATITTELGELDETGYPELKDTFWLVDVASKQVTELAQRPGLAIEHVADEMIWSPTGRYLLVRNQVFDLNGQQLSPDLMGGARWLPVTELLQASEQELLLVNGRSGLSIMTITGEEVAHITDEFVNIWAFSHDGRFLAYLDPITESYLFVFDLQSYQTQRLPTTSVNVQSLHWSGHNDFLLLDDEHPNSPIWALSLQPGSRPQVVIEKGTLIDALPAPVREVDAGTAVSIPTYTPPLDETPTSQNPVILFAHDDDLWRIGLNEDQAERLTENDALGWGMTQGGDDWRMNALSVPPQVSPNGRYVAFSPDGRTISLLDTNLPGQLRRITPGALVPSWSPDSRFLAYAAGGSLLIYNVETAETESVLSNVPQISNITWSPDMRHLAFNCCFVRPEGYSTADFGEIRQVELATGQVEIIDAATLTIGGGASSLCWNQSGQVVKQRDVALGAVVTCSYDRFAGGTSPDGKQNASTSPASTEDVFWERDSLLTVRQVESGEIVWQQQISGHAANPFWTADGTAIIFQRGTAHENNLSIWRILANGQTNPAQIIDDGYLLDVFIQP